MQQLQPKPWAVEGLSVESSAGVRNRLCPGYASHRVSFVGWVRSPSGRAIIGQWHIMWKKTLTAHCRKNISTSLFILSRDLIKLIANDFLTGVVVAFNTATKTRGCLYLLLNTFLSIKTDLDFQINQIYFLLILYLFFVCLIGGPDMGFWLFHFFL